MRCIATKVRLSSRVQFWGVEKESVECGEGRGVEGIGFVRGARLRILGLLQKFYYQVLQWRRKMGENAVVPPSVAPRRNGGLASGAIACIHPLRTTLQGGAEARTKAQRSTLAGQHKGKKET